jgi:hypothetical protein
MPPVNMALICIPLFFTRPAFIMELLENNAREDFSKTKDRSSEEEAAEECSTDNRR